MTDSDKPLDIEQRVYLERVRIFFQQSRGVYLRTGAVLFFVGLSLLYADVPLSHVSIWAAIYAFVFPGYALIGGRFRQITLTSENATRWVNIQSAMGMFTGTVIGISVFLLPLQGAVVSELIIVIVILTVISVSSMGFSTMPRYGLVISLPATGLLAIGLLRPQDPLHYALVAMTLIGLVLLLKKGRDVSLTAIEGIRVNEQLKDEVKRREEAERRAKRAREDAESANAAKSVFLANMSHELRTPMNAVIGFSDALSMGIAGELSDKQTEYVGDIQNSARHLLSLINDLLDLSKIEAGKLQIDNEVFDLPGEIDGCLMLIKDQAVKGGIVLASDIPDNLPKLSADRRLVSQMILNLLSNAVKFTPEGGSISIAARNGSEGGMAVSVTDTGFGMASQDIPRALLPFEQTESSRDKEGTGLGLPLVRQMAELHGGDLTIESVPSQGTIATITFPPERTVVGHA